MQSHTALLNQSVNNYKVFKNVRYKKMLTVQKQYSKPMVNNHEGTEITSTYLHSFFKKWGNRGENILWNNKSTYQPKKKKKWKN